VDRMCAYVVLEEWFSFSWRKERAGEIVCVFSYTIQVQILLFVLRYIISGLVWKFDISTQHYV
jgi:hypothetical protein